MFRPTRGEKGGAASYRKTAARFFRASRFGSLGLTGSPGWMHFDGHFSAAFTSWAYVPAFISAIVACLLAL